MTDPGAALLPTYARLPARFARGAGCWLWDEAGDAYLDAVAGIAVCGLGHCHPAVTAAVREQAGKLVHTSNLYRVPLQEELAARLTAATGMERAFFANSGAEANECALKLARLHGHGRGFETPRVLVADGAFHGRTLLTLSASSGARVRDGFAPYAEGFAQVPFNDLAAMRGAFDAHPDVAAVLVEPIQGEGGVRPADDAYLAGLRALCDERGALLMLDEVQTGMGRTGTMLACQGAGVAPDIATVAKALGNGYPIGACLARGAAAELLEPGRHGSTFGGSPLACRAGLAVLDVLEREELCARAAERGAALLERLRAELDGKPGVVEVRGRGLMLGIELGQPAPDLARHALEAHRLLLNVTQERVVRLLPPLVISAEEADELCARLLASLDDTLK